MLNKRSACRTCDHFLAGGVNGSSNAPGATERHDGVGLCRRYPPTWVHDSDLEDEGLFVFPTIHQDHRCGEWSDRKPGIGL